MDWKYIAGFFDGEGTVTKAGKRHRIYITQTNQEVLESIKDFTGLGNIRPINKRKSHWKDAWVYFICDKHQVKYFLENVLPYVIVKKDTTERTIQEIDVRIKKDKEKQHLKDKRLNKIKSLRAKNMSYRSIGHELKIDWSYVRLLFKGIK